MIIGYVVITLGLLSLVISRLKIDLTPGRYKVIFHEGSEPTVKTRMASGRLVVEQGSLQIADQSQTISVPLASLISVELFRLHGSMRMIRITHEQGTLFVTVVRFCIGGQFAVGDFFKTGKLVDVLNSRFCCPSCGYNLRATPKQCPECGTVFDCG